jgi:hypothetical protein
MHEASAELLLGREFDMRKFSPAELDIIDGYVSAVEQFAEGRELRVEFFVGDRFAGGTIDALVVGDEDAWVIDLKTGKQMVEVNQNWQLLFYAMHAGLFECERKLHLGIYQPSVSKEIQWWTPTRQEIAAAGMRIAKAESSREFNVGPQCSKCRAFIHCWKANQSLGAVPKTKELMAW